MTFSGRGARWVWPLVAGLVTTCWGASVRAQAPAGQIPGSRFELADTIRLERADGIVQTYLDRVKEYLVDRQWEEAVETLSEVMEQSGSRMIPLTERRFVSVREYCHLQLASMPPEALALYRSRVDPLSRKWYQDGIKHRDRQLLLNVVDQAFASSWGDNALYALGEMALESGDYATSRAYWEQALPVDPPPEGRHTWLCVPDTDLDPAAILARLVLTSILEGSRERAREELAAFERLYPNARGWLGGSEVNYVQRLSSLHVESTEWPDAKAGGDWTTFAGSPTRNAVAAKPVDPAGVVWRIDLRETLPANNSIWGSGSPTRRVAEDARSPLSYHPVLSGGSVLVNNQVEILAVDLQTGKPAWGGVRPEVYRDQFNEEVRAFYNPPENLGVPRFTMTAHDGKLYARMGSPVTSRPQDAELGRGVGYLLCLDLKSQGRLLWKISPQEKGFSFEGSPVTDGTNLYVAMRRSDIQPHMYVACFAADSGRFKWRQFVCAAETPARGMLHESTHNLLTLHRSTLYLNTDLGAVAALSADDGRLKWISLYPRARKGDLLKPAPHWCRDLNPCLYDRGRLFVAPSDSRRILALDAATGRMLWPGGPLVDDAVHLLGVSGDWLIAGGEKLYWISLKEADQGRVKYVWPNGHEKLGYGRGVLAGDCVYWPTREKIYVFQASTGQLKKAVSLTVRGASGGNLLIAGGYLLIATDNELIALGNQGPPLFEGRLASR